jgi:hypothetical protein
MEARIASDTAVQPLLVKGAYLRAYGDTLKKIGLYEAVFERASPRVREALVAPPPASNWVDYKIGIEIFTIVESLKGKLALRSFAREATRSGIAPFMQGLIQGMMRLFGVSPGTLFTHMNKLSAQTTRCGHFSYAATSEASGIVTLEVPGHRDLPPALWTASAGAFEVTFDTCGVVGHVQDPVLRADGNGNAAEFRVSWQRRSKD